MVSCPAWLPERLLGNRDFPVQLGYQIPDRTDRNHPGTSGKGGFRGVFPRNEEILDAFPFGCQRHGQNTGYRPDGTVQAHFTQKCRGGFGSAYASGCCQDTDQNRQIVMGTGFFLVRRCQIYRDPAYRKGKARRLGRCPDTLPGLLNRGIGKSHNVKAGKSVGNIALCSDWAAADSGDSQGFYAANQVDPPPSHTFSFLTNIVYSIFCKKTICFSARQTVPEI